MEFFKKYFFSSGIEPSHYEVVRTKINRANQTMLVVFSGFAVVLIGMMLCLSFFLGSAKQNRIAYTIGTIASVIILCLSIIAKRYSWLVTTLVHISLAVFFLYGIYIGTISNPTQQTVTFMVMLVFVPIIFIERPTRIVSSIMVYVAIFIALCLNRKTGKILSIDIVDALIFGFLGIGSSTIVNKIKITNYVLSTKLEEVSRIDQLTQMNNRNAFELDLEQYANNFRYALACLYVDVNGLHELNNSKGHASGDLMLKYVSDQIKRIFSERTSYRIGGDEFIIFLPDIQEQDLLDLIEEFNLEITKKEYHVAIGYEIAKTHFMNMETLVKSAESKMYQNKNDYYKKCAHIRERT